MPEQISSTPTTDRPANLVTKEALAEATPLELAQALVEKLTISDRDWHRLKNDRKARAGEQVAVALVFLLKQQPEEALARLQQASGWLDRSISAPPCAGHGKP